MNIGWMIRGGGIFGSVREALEIGNALVRRGHQFTYFCDEGKDTKWLPNQVQWAHTEDVRVADLDTLIWTDTPDDIYYNAFKASPAKLKAFCVMGFNPDQAGEKFFSDRHHEIVTNYWVLCDGPWQLKYLSKYTSDLGPAIGGINTKMFRPVDQPQQYDVMWSGDERERKGGRLVKEAIRGLNAGTYAKKGIAQNDMAAAICQAPIFVDGHNRGGFCNPVLEAMACGRAVVCTYTPCNSDFAIDNYNCLKANDAQSMRDAIEAIRSDAWLQKRLSDNAMLTVQQWDYDRVVIPLESEMMRRLSCL